MSVFIIQHKIQKHLGIHQGALKLTNYIAGVGLNGFLETRASNTLPVPRYTFTNPSPLTAEPRIDLEDLSVVKESEGLQAIAIFPSILTTSLSSSIVTSSWNGTGDSQTATPSPCKQRLNYPSPPSAAVDILLLIIAFCFNCTLFNKK